MFTEDMDLSGADFEIINYPGAKHSFTHPDADTLGEKFNLPLQYNEEADKASWLKMQAFFASIFAENR